MVEKYPMGIPLRAFVLLEGGDLKKSKFVEKANEEGKERICRLKCDSLKHYL